MKTFIKYRIFYWIPNTNSGERIAIGLCLFNKEMDQFNSYWIAQRDLTRLRNIFTYSSKIDSKDALTLLSEIKESWKSKAFDKGFWSYLERYWNGIIQVSSEKKIMYSGNPEDFEGKSESLRKKLLPLFEIKKKRKPGRPKTLVKHFEKEVKKKKIQEKVSLGTEIPEHGKYHLLQSIYFDLAARNGQIVGSAGFDMSLKANTLTKKAHAYFEGFQNIKRIEGGGDFSLVLHSKGNTFKTKDSVDNSYYDDFRYRCDDLNIQVVQIDELSDYIDSLTDIDNLKPLHLDQE